jgi:hypothetical protein
VATTGVCNSFKVEVLQGGHNLNITQAVTCTNTSAQATITALATTAGLSVGMAVTGTGVTPGSVILAITSASALTLSANSTSAISNITFAGDVFKLALVRAVPTTTFAATMTNIGTPGSSASSTSNLGTDEIAASGTYASGGVTLVNISPVLNSTAACAAWGTVSITGATISTSAAIIYNSSTRQGAAATPLNGRTVEVLDFGGVQAVTSGTLTLTFPAQTIGNAVLQIS